MVSPFTLPPHPLAQEAAAAVISRVHNYMNAHPESELHRQGKMFGVLVYEGGYLAAFSAKLDGSYHHEGFVPPVYEMETPPVGTSREESRRLQQLLFANYRFLNRSGDSKNLLELFADIPPILPPDEYFSTFHTASADRSRLCRDKNSPYLQIVPLGKELSSFNSQLSTLTSLPPSGTGECCAPKLLQYAFAHGLEPVAMAEFWVGAPSHTEIRQEGVFYAPCSGKCVPILRHMLSGMEMDPSPETKQAQALCRQIEIIFEDEYLMVVNKPSGLLSVPGKSAEPSLVTYLAEEHHLTYLQPAHRLDQDTSGLLVLAKDPETYRVLQSYFQRRDILKRYEALVRPNNLSTFHTASADRSRLCRDKNSPYLQIVPSGKELSTFNFQLSTLISLPLLPNPYDRPRQMVDREHGKPAITRYAIREQRENGIFLVDFYPLTGRTHQLRVHAAHPDGLNAPILGDRLYGTPAERLFLHAAEITFLHPLTQEEMHFCIPSGF